MRKILESGRFESLHGNAAAAAAVRQIQKNILKQTLLCVFMAIAVIITTVLMGVFHEDENAWVYLLVVFVGHFTEIVNVFVFSYVFLPPKVSVRNY